MMMTFFIFILIIIILTYYYYQYLQNHFWYHLQKNLGQSKFYSGKLHPNIYSKKDLTDDDKNGLVNLYLNYLGGILIDKEKIENFLKEMPKSEIFYMKVNSIYYGSVMNSIIEIKYKNKKYLSNFVDYAIINKYYRDKGIFKELMNYIANYSNINNVKYVIFKIDKKPIPSFYDYNLTSNYYYMTSPFGKGANPQIVSPQIVSHYYKNEDQFLKYKNSKDIIILTSPLDKDIELEETDNFGVYNLFKEEGELSKSTIIIFKRNSPESIELLYIYKPDQKNICNIIEYLYNNYSFKILMVDDIGNNSHVIKTYPKLFKIAYTVYHYILGYKDKIAKENFFYYF